MGARRYAQEELIGFVTGALVSLGNPREQAAVNAEIIVWSDLVGRYNHGLNRLPTLAKRARLGLIDLAAEPSVETLSPTAECMDANHNLGQYASHLSTHRAIAIAKEEGLGAVGVRNSNHFGICAYYVEQIAQAGMIGLVLSNSVPKVAAHNGRKPVFGTNPFAFSVPMADGRTILVDMSTAGLAGSTVLEHAAKGWPLPEGYLIDDSGAPVTDPAKAGKATLLPAAGPKGFGLALLADVLSGVLTGGAMSHQVLSMYGDFSGPVRSGHFFLALDIRRWMDLETFHERIGFLTDLIKASGEDVRLPGTNRWRAAEENRRLGIPVPDGLMKQLEQLADELEVAPPREVALTTP